MDRVADSSCPSCGLAMQDHQRRRCRQDDGQFVFEWLCPGADVVDALLADDWTRVEKRPVVVEARGPFTDPSVVATLEGDYEVGQAYIEEHGGYVLLRGVNGERYPCALDVFRQTYRLPAGDE